MLVPELRSNLDDNLTLEETSQLRSLCGQLLWATSQTRIDVAYDACRASNYGNNPTVRSIVEANKAIKKLQSTKSKLVFPDVGDPKKLHVEVYKDASHASIYSIELI